MTDTAARNPSLPPFSSEFLWGTATSAHQVEGNNRNNDWWEFEQRFTPSGRASDFVGLFSDDLDRARDLGSNTFRFSLEWSRVEPQSGQRDAAAIRYYEQLIRACLDRGLRPMMTLVQFTLPRWTAGSKRGGWLDPETHRAFERHVRWVADRFGDCVDLFVTLNEPNVQAGAGYLSGVFPPGKRFRPDLADRCQAELVGAHALAYRTLHEEVARRHPGRSIQVGVSPHVLSWRPSRSDVGGFAGRFGEQFNWGFLDALASGSIRFNLVSRKAPEIRDCFDFVGLNYFMGMPANLVGVLRLACLVSKKIGAETSDNGWPIDPGGLEGVVREAHRRYGKPIFVTENGVADADDSRRPAYLVSQVAGLGRAAAEGADVRGYYHWSLIDNFEWHEGFAPRFGLYAVDYETQKREPRPSCGLYARIIAAGGVTTEMLAAHADGVLGNGQSASPQEKR